jgi:hypothetical protein
MYVVARWERYGAVKIREVRDGILLRLYFCFGDILDEYHRNPTIVMRLLNIIITP